MGCLPACFRSSRRKITAKKCQCCHEFSQNLALLQIQKVSEAKVKLIDAATKSVTEEQIVNPVSESELKSERKSLISCEEKDVSVVEKHVDTITKLITDNLVREDVTEDKKKWEKSRDESSNCNLPSLDAHPTNQSPQELIINDKECVDVNSKNISSDGFKATCTTQCCVEPEESSESLFSLSIDSRRQVYAAEAEVGEKEVMSPFKLPADTKTAAISSNGADKKENERNPQLKGEEDKENMNVNSSRINAECVQYKSVDAGIAADTSLSSWLVESQKMTKNIDDSPESEKNYENRRMLEEIIPLKLKQLNVDSSSALSTPSCVADSKHSVGTLGSHWLRY